MVAWDKAKVIRIEDSKPQRWLGEPIDLSHVKVNSQLEA